MAIESFPESDLTLGRGRLYFALRNQSTGVFGPERYLGATPTVTLERAAEELDHFSTESGIRVKDKTVTLEDNITVVFATEDMTAQNIALFFYGDVTESTQDTVTGAEETVTAALGTFIQLGADNDHPSGKRGLANVTVTVGEDTVATPAEDNYEVDTALGRIYLLPNADAITDGDTLTIEYDVTAAERTVIVDSSNAIEGSLRFIADNPEGSNTDMFIKYVKLTPDGQYALKGDEWQQVGFRAEVLRLGTHPRVVVDKR